MKKLLLAATALSLMAAPAFAQSATINLSGEVVAKCSPSGTFGPIPLPVTADLSNATGGLNAALINALTVGQTGAGVCNGVDTKITVTATPLTGSNPPPASAPAAFTNIINYTAAVVVSGYTQFPGPFTDSTTTTTGTTSNLGLVNATGVAVNIDDAALPEGASILIAGDYKGSVTIAVTPEA